MEIWILLPQPKHRCGSGNPENEGDFLELETTSSNLRKYLISDEIRVRLKTTSSEPLMNDLLLDLQSKVEVDAKILGI